MLNYHSNPLLITSFEFLILTVVSWFLIEFCIQTTEISLTILFKLLASTKALVYVLVNFPDYWSIKRFLVTVRLIWYLNKLICWANKIYYRYYPRKQVKFVFHPTLGVLMVLPPSITNRERFLNDPVYAAEYYARNEPSVWLLFKRYISELINGKRYCGPKQLPENLDFTRRIESCELLNLEEAGFRFAAQMEIQNTPWVHVEGWDRLAGTSGNDFTFISPLRTGKIPFIPQAQYMKLLAEERAKREYEARIYPDLALRPRVFHDTLVDCQQDYQQEMAQRHDIAAADPSYYVLTQDMKVIRVPHYVISDPEIMYDMDPVPTYSFADFKPMFPIEDERCLYDYTEPKVPDWILIDVNTPKYFEMFGSILL